VGQRTSEKQSVNLWHFWHFKALQSALLRFSLRLARALFRDHYFYYFYFSKPDLSDFLDVKHLEYATGLLKNYTIVMAGASAFE
jgi:hypothetical protein